jgi:hypothetical protein
VSRVVGRWVGGFGAGLAGLLGFAWVEMPAIGAGALLHPARHVTTRPAPEGCADTTFDGDGVTLRGWRCATAVPRRATIIYLHGIADNRASAAGAIARFLPLGYDVIAYDGRAHGDSTGDACTYGFYEKRDLRRVIDTVGGPVILIGASLGAAVELQEAADDPRVRGIVGAETFSDLRTVATERAPRFFTRGQIERAFRLAEHEGDFTVDEVSPVHAAARITVPVLLIHGDADVDTPPAHSRRVFDALRGPKQLMLVPGATHNASLRPEVWREVETFVRRVA